MSNEFIEKVRSWVQLDNDIKKYNEHMRQLRHNKHIVTNEICEYMEHNSLTGKTIEISKGTLKYAKKKEYAPLTFGYVEECLKKVLSSGDDVDYIMQYIRDNREIKTVSDIRRNDAK